METKPYNIQAPESIAKDFGGDKQKIAAAAQSGMLDPTAAVLAGMFIDRMRSAQAMEQAPNTTVAQDIMAAPQQPMMPQGQMPQGQMPQGQMPQGQMPQPQPEGIDALPVNEEMFEFSGGGIVAFAEGDEVKGGLSAADRNKLIQQRMRGEISRDEYAQLMDRGAVGEFTAPDLSGVGGDLMRSAKDLVRPPEAEGYGLVGAVGAPLRRVGMGALGAAGAGYNQLKDSAAAYMSLPNNLKPIWSGLVGERGEDDAAAILGREQAGTATPEDKAAIARAEQKAAQESEQGLPAMSDVDTLADAISAMPQTTAPQADTAGLGALAQQSGVPSMAPAPTRASASTLLGRAQSEAAQLMGDRDMPDKPDAQAAFEQQQMFNQMAGVNPDILKNIADEVRQEREDSKTSKKDAANMRIVEAGLNIMAGESPYAMTNIGKGASKAFEGYADDIKEIKKLDREMAKQERDIMLAEDQMRRGEASGAAANYDKMTNRYEDAQKERSSLAGNLYEMLQKDDTQRYVAETNALGVMSAAESQAAALRADNLQRQYEQMKLNVNESVATFDKETFGGMVPADRQYAELKRQDPVAAEQYRQNQIAQFRSQLEQGMPSLQARTGTAGPTTSDPLGILN